MSLKHFDFCRYVSNHAPLYNIGQTKEKIIYILQKKKDLKNHQNTFVVQT
jgi:hypothetical protein